MSECEYSWQSGIVGIRGNFIVTIKSGSFRRGGITVLGDVTDALALVACSTLTSVVSLTGLTVWQCTFV